MVKDNLPNYAVLIEATYQAIRQLGGSGRNSEINATLYVILDIPDRVPEVLSSGRTSFSEIDFRSAWARTLLKNYGAIENSARSVWSITPAFSSVESVDGNYIEKNCRNVKGHGEIPRGLPSEAQMESCGLEPPEEVKPWRKKLYDVLINMDPYGFERLTKRVLREYGFTQVEVTKKSGDGGIDGTGKLKINGIFTLNIAFQCKRYQGMVGARDIRNFRGSLTTNSEKGVFITTGSFSRSAIEEASSPGKQQIDLIDGEEFITKLAEFGIGVKEVKDYRVDEDYFARV